jgi:hypothetical protein
MINQYKPIKKTGINMINNHQKWFSSRRMRFSPTNKRWVYPTRNLYEWGVNMVLPASSKNVTVASTDKHGLNHQISG